MTRWEARPVGPEDCAFLAALYQSEAVLRALHGRPCPEEDWRRAIGEWANDRDEENEILLADGERAGWIKRNGLLGPGLPYLSMLVIAPAYQRKGGGRFGLGRCEQLLAARGYPGMRIRTTRDNEAALGLYLCEGYTIVWRGRMRNEDGQERYGLRLEKAFASLPSSGISDILDV